MFGDISMSKKILQFLPVLPVYCIIFTVIYGFTAYYTLAENDNLIKYIAVPSFYTFASMVIVCHTMSMLTNPGNIDVRRVYVKAEVNDPLFCKKCNSSRPERSHHCKQCNKCVLKMDHHCPWVANCVGLYNQKHFYLFLLYATFGNLIAFLCLVDKIFNLDFKVHTKVTGLIDVIIVMKDPLITVISTMLSFAMTASIGLLFCIQSNLILTNTTTLETKIYESHRNPWENNRWLNNFKLVMGNPLIWLLPIYVNNELYNTKYYNKELAIPTNTGSNYISLTDTDDTHINLNLND